MNKFRLFTIFLIAIAMTAATVLIAIPGLLDTDSTIGKVLTYSVASIVGLTTAGIWVGFAKNIRSGNV